MNLITPERRLHAIAEVKEGLVFSLSLPLDYPGGSVVSHGLRHPPKLFASSMAERATYNSSLSETMPGCCDISCDDGVILHTQYSTQWDSLAHWGQEFDADGDGLPEKVYYNGFRANIDVLGPDGDASPHAGALGIDHLAATGAQGRGSLVNLHSIYGSERVAVGYDELMQAVDAQKVVILPGDFLVPYIGYDDVLLKMNKQPDAAILHNFGAVLNGRDQRLLNWITDSGIVAICTDNPGVEAVTFPSPDAPQQHGFTLLPLHEHCLFKQGIYLGELWFLRDLAAWLSAHRRSSFLLTAPPLRLPGAVGSPVTPVATV